MHRGSAGIALAALALFAATACSYEPSALQGWPEEPSCGRFENLNEPLSAEHRRGNQCLLDAFAAGRPAELVVTTATIDSGPITHYFRVLGQRRVEVFVDATNDTEGSSRWVHLVCNDVREGDGGFVSADYGSCREISVDETVS
jgi:hypothetical protein